MGVAALPPRQLAGVQLPHVDPPAVGGQPHRALQGAAVEAARVEADVLEEVVEDVDEAGFDNDEEIGVLAQAVENALNRDVTLDELRDELREIGYPRTP